MSSVTADALAALLPSWQSTLRVRSEHTARGYGHAVGRFLDHLGAEAVDAAAIGRYLDSLLGLAPASRGHHVSAVRSFLRFAQSQGVLDRGPLELLVRPRVAVTSYGRYLDEEELQQLVAAAAGIGPRHFAAVMLLAGTGLRVAEAAAATWRDLFRDPDGRLGLRVIGKGSKERVVKIRGDVFASLVALHGADQLDQRDTTALLPDSRNTAYTTRGLHKLIAQAVEASGIRKRVSPHWLRHTHATLAAANGASAFVIQAGLGHARLETSARYVHLARGLEETTVDALPPLAHGEASQ
jgi:integrase/recombinase XerD